MTDSRYKNYKANEDRIILKDGLLYRQYFGETGSVKNYQILILKQLVKDVLRSLHGEIGKHPGIFKTIIAHREKYYFPKMAQLIREWVISCEQCIRESRIDRSLTRPPMQNPNEHITAPEYAMQIDLVPELPPYGGYENIVTAMDVFSSYLFAYPTSNQDANTIAKVLNNIMTKHAYLPTTLISDKGTAFMSHVIKEVAGVLGITLKHATTKHAQTIGLLERSHAWIKQALKIETGERRSLWHKYINIAVLNYNTSYHTSIGCEPSRVFHGRFPYNISDLKLGIRPNSNPFLRRKLPKMFFTKQKWSIKMFARIQCKRILNTKPTTTKMPTLQNLKKQITYISCSRKRIIKEAKFHSQNFAGWARILLRKCYQTTIIWYAKLALTRRKCFTECECVSSHPANHQPIYESIRTNTNPIPKWVLITDDLYASAWEHHYEQPIFDDGNNDATQPDPKEIPIQSDLPTGEMRNTLGNTHDCSPEIFPPTDESSDVADTYTYVEPDVGTSSEQQRNSPSNPRSSKYNLRHNPKPNCNDDYRY